MSVDILDRSKQIEKKVIALRRELHKYPEIGLSLPKTREIVKKALDDLGIPYRLNTGDDGIVAEIKGKGEGKTIAFRADMDALMLDEKTGLEFSSEIEGNMHACGHDAHTAILLGAAEIINNHKDELNGNVRLIFQTGEETGNGALQMLKEGALDGVDAICAIHVGNLAGDSLPAGSLVVIPGPVSAGKGRFSVTIKGKGTHSAFPEKGVDPIVIGARIVNACDQIQSRELPAGTAAVLTFGTFHSGTEHNTIPDTAIIEGSFRVQDPNVKAFVAERLKCICENIAKAYRAECVVEFIKDSKSVINDDALSAHVAQALGKVLGTEAVVTRVSSPLMGSDDFSNYSSRIPGVYFFLCTNNPDKGITEANHNPAFDVDESTLSDGVAAYCAIAFDYLK